LILLKVVDVGVKQSGHVRGLLEDNLPIPESTSFAEYVVVH
jgi:predicted RNase H-like HicB family nuclease